MKEEKKKKAHTDKKTKNSHHKSETETFNIRHKSSPKPWIFLSVFLGLVFLVTQMFQIDISIKPKFPWRKTPNKQSNNQSKKVDINNLSKKVVPINGVELPIKWGNLGNQMVEKGVIDVDKFRNLFGGKLSEKEEAMLTGTWNKKVIMTNQNSRFLLDLLWAFGLSNKNDILENGEMAKREYGGAGNFASTGGWTLSKGKTMNHYSSHVFIDLTPQQQALVDEVSKNIYRPCCGNSTHFPDCNHGMAMLGLLELIASQGSNMNQMYKTALAANSFWFPQTYIDLATYFKEQGQDWDRVDPKLVLGSDYSSGQGYQKTRAKIKSLPPVQKGGGGCGA